MHNKLVLSVVAVLLAASSGCGLCCNRNQCGTATYCPPSGGCCEQGAPVITGPAMVTPGAVMPGPVYGG